jgi:hypothetical protein
MASNPFEVLRLDPSVSEEEIVLQAGRLRQRFTEEAELTPMRQAVQQLTSNADERQLQAMLTHPAPEYATPLLDRLAATFRRLPVVDRATQPVPALDEQVFLEMILTRAAEELEMPAGAFEAVTATEDAAEIDVQLGEAAWQCLIHDLGA